MNRLVFRAFARDEQFVSLGRSFHQHGDDGTEVKLVLLVGVLLHDVDQAVEALLDNLVWRIVDHFGRRRPFALRVDEREHLVVANGVNKTCRVLEVLLRLAWEANDDVG